MVEGKNSEFLMYRNKEESEKIEEFVSKKAKDKVFVRETLNKYENAFNDLKVFCVKIKETDLELLSDKKLAEFLAKYSEFLPRVTIAASTAILLASALSQQLEIQLSKNLPEQKLQRDLGILSSPFKSPAVLIEEKEFVGLVNQIKSDSSKLKQVKKGWIADLDGHFNKFKFINSYFDGPDWDKRRFLNRIKEAVEVELIEPSPADNTNKKIEKIVKENSLDSELVDLLRKVMFYRTEAEIDYGFANYCSRNLFSVISQRLGLTAEEFKRFTFKELADFLEKNKKPDKNIIKERNHYVILVTPQGPVVLSGNNAEALIEEMNLEEESYGSENKLLNGLSASHGLVRGKTKIVLKVNDLNKVEKGDILVAPNTTPSFVPAMKKAAGIITDEGGITCHAAIISRELGIPCVTGTRIATKVLNDGDEVEVDATHGKITVLKKAKR